MLVCFALVCACSFGLHFTSSFQKSKHRDLTLCMSDSSAHVESQTSPSSSISAFSSSSLKVPNPGSDFSNRVVQRLSILTQTLTPAKAVAAVQSEPEFKEHVCLFCYFPFPFALILSTFSFFLVVGASVDT